MLSFSDTNINLLKHTEDLSGRHYAGYEQMWFYVFQDLSIKQGRQSVNT